MYIIIVYLIYALKLLFIIRHCQIEILPPRSFRVRVILRVILEVLEVKYLQIRCFEIFIVIFRRKMDDAMHKRLNKKMRYLVDDIKKRIMRIV